MTEQTAGNHAGSHIELPDEGMSFAELAAMTDAYRRRRLRLEADRQGRIDVHGNIIPKPANSNAAGGTANGNGSATGGGAAGATASGYPGGHPGSGARQEAPIFIDPVTAAATAAAGGIEAILWLPTTRKGATEQCGVALARRAERLFRRGRALAILALPDPSENTTKEEDGRPKLTIDLDLRRARIAQPADLRRQLDEAGIVFTGPGRGAPKRGGEQKYPPIHPPSDPLETIIKEPELCPARRLMGIAHVPFMDDRGDIDMTGGYKPQTGIFHDLSRLGQLAVPDRPTSQGVTAAIATLLHPFQHYENFTKGDPDGKQRFVGEVLTFALSSIERAFIQRAPMLMINGNVAGLGKSEWCQAMAWLGYGTRGDLINFGENTEEFDKRIDSILIDGPPVFIIDNLNHHLLTNHTLATYSTEGRTKIRPFGRKGGDIDVEGRSLIFINGNKLLPSRDNVRRAFVLELLTTNPQPWLRPDFPFHPVEEVKRTRTAMLSAAFTLRRWWRQQGMPKSGKVLGSFDEWSRRVGDLVGALTDWHPADSVAANSAGDLFGQQQEEAMNTLAARFGLGNRCRSSDVADITAGVLGARRSNTPYILGSLQLDHRLHPAYWAALSAEVAAAAALEAAVKSGQWPKPEADMKKDVDDAAASRKSEEQAAQQLQVRLDRELTEAMQAVTREGRTDSNAIGRWFTQVERLPLEGKMLVREKRTGSKLADVMVVRI